MSRQDYTGLAPSLTKGATQVRAGTVADGHSPGALFAGVQEAAKHARRSRCHADRRDFRSVVIY
jgi:hypothetical protein